MITEQQCEGGCLCGKIRYKALGKPLGSGYCHCKTCRHHTGAPIAAYVVFNLNQVTWATKEPARYESSAGVYRGFCRDCGSSLTWEAVHKGKKLVEFHISSLDKPEDFPPNEHTHYSERIEWLVITDELPKFHASIE